MKILHVIDHLGLGGAQTVLGEFVRCWPEPSDVIHVVAMGTQTDLGEFCRSIAKVQVTVLGGGKSNLRVVRRVARWVNSGDYQFVHAHLTKATYATLWGASKSDSRIIVHLHTSHFQFWLRAAVRCWGKKIDQLIPCSHHSAKIARRCFPELGQRIQAIQNGIDFRQLDAVQPYGQLRDEFGISRDDIVLGFAGRLADEKGVTYLLKAMASLVREQPKIYLVIMGDGPLRHDLQREVADLGVCERVKFVGFRSDARSWMRMLDIGVLPSLQEGLSITLLEMMGLGIPVIATNVGGTPEIITTKHTGILVAPRDVEALAQAIRWYSTHRDERERHASLGRECVRRQFCIRRNAIKMRRLYESRLFESASLSMKSAGT